MKIFARIVKNKIPVGYIIGDSEKSSFAVSAEKCIDMHLQCEFSNAILCQTKKFKGKDNVTIETVEYDDYIKKYKRAEIAERTAKIIKHSQEESNKPLNKKTGYVLEKETQGYEFVGLCRKIRRAIRQNRLHVDVTQHNSNSGRNTQYFKFIRACGYDVRKFITTYLYNMQPCTLQIKDRVKTTDGELLVLLDIGYKINLYIKVQQSGDVVVSFHDDIFRGRIKTKASRKHLFDATGSRYSYILLNEPATPSDNMFEVYMSRGMSVLKRRLYGEYCAVDLVKIPTDALNDSVKSLMLTLLSNLAQTYTFRDKESRGNFIDTFQKTGSLSSFSFTSFGDTPLSQLSLLIDTFPMSRISSERADILTAIEVIVEDMLFLEDKGYLYEAITERYADIQPNPAYVRAIQLLR